MRSTDGAGKSDGYAERWGKVLAQLKWACGRAGTDDDQQSAWLMWAQNVLHDMHHLKRQPAFPAPEEMDGDWLRIRKLTMRMRKPRTRLKPSEMALLMDVGDYLMQLRVVETENAATLECLLHAAWLFWDMHGQRENVSTTALYEHIANEWGVMAPPVHELPADRERVMHMCRRWMREEDLCPSWYFHARPIPRGLDDDAKPEEGVEQTKPPKTADMFDEPD